MKFKKILLITTLLVLFTCTGIFAESEYDVSNFVDPDIPESWYESPQLASDLNLNEFNQSPMLEKKVNDGELPSVEERLPVDPPTIEPYEEIGKYGGTAVVWAKDDYRGNTMYFNWPENAGGPAKPTPDGRKMIPWLAKDWEYNDEATKLTVYLREGLKWSDGEPFDADDFMFWWEHITPYEELGVAPENFTPVPLIDLEKNDDHTITFTFKSENPRYHQYIFYIRWVTTQAITPAHYMEQFHPDFVDKEEIEKMAQDVGLNSWHDYYLRIHEDSPNHPEYEHQRPVLRPYIVKERTPTHMIWERNPYWPFIDTEGNQLPYIDNVRVNVAAQPEIAAAKAATGDATIAARFVQTEDIPLYKKNAKEENYEVYFYSKVYGSEVSIQGNLTHQDPRLRNIFQDDRFRKAISLAINRDEINKKVYYDQAISMQATIPPTSQYFKQEYAESYVEYNPEKAKELLDDMGMVDVNEDGFREGPDGEKFNPVMDFAQIGPVDPTSVVEVIQPHLSEVGLDIQVKKINRNLHDTRWDANEGDMHAVLWDQLVDLAFGVAEKDFVPATAGGKDTPWPGWVTWFGTNGEKGMEPPDKIKELFEYRKDLGFSSDPEKRDLAAQKILEAQAENLWVIGTVSMVPQPVLVNNKLKNVPKKGIWDWRTGYMYPYRSSQWYLEE